MSWEDLALAEGERDEDEESDDKDSCVEVAGALGKARAGRNGKAVLQGEGAVRRVAPAASSVVMSSLLPIADQYQSDQVEQRSNIAGASGATFKGAARSTPSVTMHAGNASSSIAASGG